MSQCEGAAARDLKAALRIVKAQSRQFGVRMVCCAPQQPDAPSFQSLAKAARFSHLLVRFRPPPVQLFLPASVSASPHQPVTIAVFLYSVCSSSEQKDATGQISPALFPGPCLAVCCCSQYFASYCKDLRCCFDPSIHHLAARYLPSRVLHHPTCPLRFQRQSRPSSLAAAIVLFAFVPTAVDRARPPAGGDPSPVASDLSSWVACFSLSDPVTGEPCWTWN